MTFRQTDERVFTVGSEDTEDAVSITIENSKPSAISRFPKRLWLGVLTTVALLSACRGSQLAIAGHGPSPAHAATDSSTAPRSLIASEASAGDLLYVSTETNGVSVFSYPGGKLLGSLSGFEQPLGLCSDSAGDVFIVDSEAQDIVEYAHGGSAPVLTLDDAGNAPNGCFVDPASGNLAVAGGTIHVEGNLAIYKGAKGSPTVYSDSGGPLLWCTYDNQGNVFAVGGPYFALVELPKGHSALASISLDTSINIAGAIQWDGKYLAIADPHGGGRGTHGPTTLYQVQISGSAGTVVNKIELSSGKRNRNPGLGVQFWVQKRMVISPKTSQANVGLWHYPSGGHPAGNVKVDGHVLGVTVSVGSDR